MIAWCVRVECNRQAELLPQIKLFAARAVYPRMKPALIQIGLTFCRRCAQDVTVGMLVPPGDWPPLVAKFMELKSGIRPDLATATIEWLPLSSQEALDFIATIPAPNKHLVH